MSAMEARSAHFARTHSSQPAFPGTRSLGPAIAGVAQDAWTAVCEWYEQRRAVAHLRSLPDTHLQDLGLKRWEITAAVYGERKPRRTGDGRTV